MPVARPERTRRGGTVLRGRAPPRPLHNRAARRYRAAGRILGGRGSGILPSPTREVRMRLSHDVPTRLCRVLFTVLMAVAWTRAPAAAAEPAAASSPGHDHGQPAEPLTPEQRKKAAATLDRALRLVDAMDREGPRDTFDVKAVVASAGRDPVKLFEWVRDRTHWVCYAGALRGPVGVLMDRVGNSLDRSLLLAELLRNAGHKVRLMRAELTAEQAQALL